MNPDVERVLNRVRDTADFGSVEFRTINDINALGDNALHCVCVWGDMLSAKVLVDNGINVNQRGEFGFTPLRVAAEFGHDDLVKYLLACGSDSASLDVPETYDAEAHARHINDLGKQISVLEEKVSSCDEKRKFVQRKSEA